MGIADRDYHRMDRRDSSGPFAQLTPTVKWLLILNLGIYFIDLILSDDAGNRQMRDFGLFTMQSAIFEGKIWEFLTFQFLHANVAHVFANSLGIFFFGPFMERWWGARKFLVFYLVCGVAGALCFSVLVMLGVLPGDGFNSQLVGASAGLYGILIGVAYSAPSLQVRLLFPPIELTMRQLASAAIIFAVTAVLFKIGGNEGGEAGHLGGAVLGFILMRFPWILGSRQRIDVIRPKVVAQRGLPKLRPRTELEKTQDTEVDKLLDKISREGFQSLTQEELDFLHKASNQK